MFQDRRVQYSMDCPLLFYALLDRNVTTIQNYNKVEKAKKIDDKLVRNGHISTAYPVARIAKGRSIYCFNIPLHLGKSEQPQKFSPEYFPCLAVLNTI